MDYKELKIVLEEHNKLIAELAVKNAKLKKALKDLIENEFTPDYRGNIYYDNAVDALKTEGG